jgi:hypothetical protein
MPGPRAVHRGDEKKARFAGLQSRLKNALPELMRVDLADRGAV